MLTNLERHWPKILIFVSIIFVAMRLFVPESAKTLAYVLLLLSLGGAVFFVVHRQVQAYHEGQTDRLAMLRNIFFRVLGLLIIITLAIALAQIIVVIITPFISEGWLGIVAIIVLSILVGLAAAWLVKVTWWKLVKLDPD